MSIRYRVEANTPFLVAVALVSNRDRQVRVLASDKSTVRATVEQVTVSDPGEDADVLMILLADEVLPGSVQYLNNPITQLRGETIQVNIPDTDDYQTFVVRQISSN